MVGYESEFAKLAVIIFKTFLKVRRQSVSGNKQGLVARATGC